MAKRVNALLGSRLERWIDRSEFSRADLAEILDIHYDAIKRILKGEREISLIEGLLLIEAIGVNIKELREVVQEVKDEIKKRPIRNPSKYAPYRKRTTGNHLIKHQVGLTR